MRSAELAKTNYPAIDPNTGPERLYIAVQGFGQQAVLVATETMDFARRLDSACRVVSLTDWKVEDCHNRVPDRLVEQPVIFPDSGCAFVVEDIENGSNLRLRQRLRQRRITSQVREQHADVNA